MISSFMLPLCLVAVLFYALIKRVDVYDAFAKGIKSSLELIYSIFPYLCTILIMTEIMDKSGVNELIAQLFKPLFQFLKIPTELSRLLILKPFSGSGSLALLAEVLEKYGADSYISRCACLIFGSSETVFYISAVYFAKCKKRGFAKVIALSLLSIFLSQIFACFICRLFFF